SGLPVPLDTVPSYAPTSIWPDGTWLNAPPSTAISMMPPSAQVVPLPSIRRQCSNWKLSPVRSSGSATTGEVSRWSAIDDGSTAFHDATPSNGRLPEIVHESVPAAASCVQPLVPLSTLSSNSTSVVVPVPHWPGPGCVVNEKTALVVPPQS